MFISPREDDHLRTRKWFGSPQFISHEEAISKGNVALLRVINHLLTGMILQARGDVYQRLGCTWAPNCWEFFKWWWIVRESPEAYPQKNRFRKYSNMPRYFIYLYIWLILTGSM